jgi:putative ABC transport system permease protein
MGSQSDRPSEMMHVGVIANLTYVGNLTGRAIRMKELVAEDLVNNIAHGVRWHDATTVLQELGFKGNYMMARALAIRTVTDPMSLLSAVRQVIWSIDPEQPISDVMTMDDILDREVEQRRNQASLLGGLAALALILACVGIYGVMAYLVAQQNHEFGVRAALGAGPGDIFGLVLGRGIKLTATGVGIGIAAALLVTRLMRSLLFGVSSFDPLTLGGVVLLLTLVALAACYVPARRAMRIDPMVALHFE